MSEEKEPIVVDFDEDEQKVHWLKMIDYHNSEIDKLNEQIKEHKAQVSEAEEEFFEDVPAKWDTIQVCGRAVYARETKQGTRRLYIEDLRDKYPKIAEELMRSKDIEKVRRIQ